MESDTVFRRTCLGSVLSNVPPRDIVTVKNWAKSIDHRVCLFMCGGVLSERGVTYSVLCGMHSMRLEPTKSRLDRHANHLPKRRGLPLVII